MLYPSNDDLPIVVRQMLPRDALDVFRGAANKAADEHSALVDGWAEVDKGWRKPDKRGDKWVKRPKQKAMPGPSDVHVPTTEPDRKKKPKDEAMTKTELSAAIVKADEDARMVYGWASVISEKGEPVVDTQGDVIEPDEMVKATTDFMADARMAKAMHKGEGIGEVLHSFPLTKELAGSLGIESEREGWIVGVKVHSDDIWAKVKDGTYKAFSIGGMGVREPVEAE